MSAPLLLGLDVGGTSSRAVVTDTAGAVLGTGRAGGGNPVARGVSAAVDAIEGAARAALEGADPGAVAAAVIGLAGGDSHEAAMSAALGRVWRRFGLPVAPRRVGDVTLAFVAGTADADGTVLVAGTGAVAGRLRGRELVESADGHGWLLGDRGSGAWIGRAAVVGLLERLDAGTALSTVDRSALDALGVAADRAAVHAAVYARGPAWLAELAPVVLAGADAGEPGAERVVSAAARELLLSAALVREHPDEPLVLAGGLLASDNPLARRVSAEAAARWPAATVTVAGDGALAAAWLAGQAVADQAIAGWSDRPGQPAGSSTNTGISRSVRSW